MQQGYPQKRKDPKKRNLDFIDPNSKQRFNGERYTPQETAERLNFWLSGMTNAVPTMELVGEFIDRYNVKSREAALYWRNRALQYICSTQTKDIDHFKAMQAERLNDLYRRCLEANQFKTAESVLDTLNKLMGVYKQDTVIVAPITQFNFGDERQITTVENADQVQEVLDYYSLANEAGEGEGRSEREFNKREEGWLR